MYRLINEEMDFHTIKTRRAFRRSVPFWKIFENRCRLVWMTYSWFNMTGLYTQWLQAYQRKGRLSHLIQSSTSLSAFGSILKDFWETDIGRCEGRTFGLIWHDSIHNGYKHTNEKVDYHITKIRRAFRHSVPFLKDFWETDVGRCEGRTFGLVWQDSIHNGYKHTNKKVDYHITKIWRAFWRSVPFFLKSF